VLRYLADAYRALRQTVPPEARTEDVQDITEWLGETVRQVDSSLLDEWENLTDPTFEEDGTPVVAYGADTPKPISANPRAFRIMVRNALFRRVELASRRRWDLLEELGDEVDWQDELEPYFEEYGEIGMTTAARGPHLFSFVQTREETTARQVLDDPDGDHGWSLDATVDVEESDALAEIVFDDITVTAG
jgi:hypothetical protein